MQPNEGGRDMFVIWISDSSDFLDSSTVMGYLVITTET